MERARAGFLARGVVLAMVISVVAAPPASAAVRASQITAAAATAVPRYDHVLTVIMENHSAQNIIGNAAAPYINSLATTGASMTRSYAITHPSQPNYLALFAGAVNGVVDDTCPHTLTSGNLGSQLLGAGLGFVGYSESMPSVGFTGCGNGLYARKHNPWVNFTNVPTASNQPLTSIPADWAALPTVSIVVPNLQNDMHDGTIAQADTWLRDHFDPYVQWAKQHNSLFLLTFDEDDNQAGNRIPTIFAGAGVRTGQYPEHIDHYSVLRTLQDMYGLAPLANSAAASPILDIWDAAPGGQPLAADAFGRTLSSGWGTADAGGAWMIGTASKYSVSGGLGTTIVTAGQTNSALLPGVASSDSDLRVTTSVDKLPAGGGLYIGIIGRHTGTNLDYQARLRVRSDGSALLSLLSLPGTTTPTTLKPEVTVPGANLANSAAVKVRLQVVGVSPTTIRAKAWAATGTEPAAWQLTATDSYAGLQAAGSVGMNGYLSSTSTVTPVATRFGDLSMLPTLSTDQPPQAAFSGSCTVLTCSVDGGASVDRMARSPATRGHGATAQ